MKKMIINHMILFRQSVSSFINCKVSILCLCSELFRANYAKVVAECKPFEMVVTAVDTIVVGNMVKFPRFIMIDYCSQIRGRRHGDGK
jgi:hypothetical protein